MEQTNHGPSIYNLPQEILCKITSCLPREAILSLLGVSRVFRAVGTGFFYREVTFKSISSIMRFCDIVMQDEAVAKAVKVLRFDSFDIVSENQPQPLSSTQKLLLESALDRVAPGLFDLQIITRQRPEDDFIRHVHAKCFPQLQKYNLTNLPLEITPEDMEFIRRNVDQLEVLALYDRIENYEEPLTTRLQLYDSAVVSLPNLRSLRTSPDVAPLFRPGKYMDFLSLAITEFHHQDKIIAAFEAAKSWDCHITRLSYNSVDSRYLPMPPEIYFYAIPQYLPNLTQLTFQMLQKDGLDSEAVYSALEDILPNIGYLHTLMVTTVKCEAEQIVSTEQLNTEQLNNELCIAERWGRLSRSLRMVVLPGRLGWARNEFKNNAIWLPSCDSTSDHPQTAGHLILDFMRQNSRYEELFKLYESSDSFDYDSELSESDSDCLYEFSMAVDRLEDLSSVLV